MSRVGNEEDVSGQRVSETGELASTRCGLTATKATTSTWVASARFETIYPSRCSCFLQTRPQISGDAAEKDSPEFCQGASVSCVLIWEAWPARYIPAIYIANE